MIPVVVSADRFQHIIDRVVEYLGEMNDNGMLHETLAGIGLQGLITDDDDFDMGECDNAYGDIIVLGKREAKENSLLGVAKDLGYNRERFTFVGYDEMQQFDVQFLHHTTRYSAVMCGPVPHKAGGMGDVSSALEKLRHPENGYPPFVELRVSGGDGELRITNNSFRAGLAKLEKMNAIRPNHKFS